MPASATPAINMSSEESKDNTSDLLAGAPSYSSNSPHSRLDNDTHGGERHCNCRSEDVCCLGLLHEVAPAVPSAGQTRARTLCSLRRRDGKECRLYTHNGTKALIRHFFAQGIILYYTPETIC